MIGRVVSDKTALTVTVLVESRKTHLLYKKSYAWSKKYLVHDELGAKMGDLVEIVKTRPYSKRKHWKVTKVVGKDIVPMSEEALKEVSKEVIEEVMPEEKEQVELAAVSNQQSAESNEEKESKSIKEKKVKKAGKEKADSGKLKADSK